MDEQHFHGDKVYLAFLVKSKINDSAFWTVSSEDEARPRITCVCVYSDTHTHTTTTGVIMLTHGRARYAETCRDSKHHRQ